MRVIDPVALLSMTHITSRISSNSSNSTFYSGWALRKIVVVARELVIIEFFIDGARNKRWLDKSASSRSFFFLYPPLCAFADNASYCAVYLLPECTVNNPKCGQSGRQWRIYTTGTQRFQYYAAPSVFAYFSFSLFLSFSLGAAAADGVMADGYAPSAVTGKRMCARMSSSKSRNQSIGHRRRIDAPNWMRHANASSVTGQQRAKRNDNQKMDTCLVDEVISIPPNEHQEHLAVAQKKKKKEHRVLMVTFYTVRLTPVATLLSTFASGLLLLLLLFIWFANEEDGVIAAPPCSRRKTLGAARRNIIHPANRTKVLVAFSFPVVNYEPLSRLTRIKKKKKQTMKRKEKKERKFFFF